MRNPWRYFYNSVMLLIIVDLIFAFMIFPCNSRDIKYLSNANNDDLHFQKKLLNIENKIKKGDHKTRRILRAIGSIPPRCTSRCGKCTPCKPVHIPVPPGTPVTAEYYPEAWRCKCGNRLYMPYLKVN